MSDDENGVLNDGLEEHIRAILQSTPVDDLARITAKDVRARLLAKGVVDEAYVRQKKKPINALIASVFEEVSAPLVPVPPPSESAYINGEEGEGETVTYSEREGTESQYAEDDDQEETSGGPSTPPAKSRKKSSKRALTDEEYARRLSSELNGRPRSSRLSGGGKTQSRPKKKAGVSRTPKRNKKSADVVNDSDLDSGGASDDDDENVEYDSDGHRISKPPTKKRKSRRSHNGNEEGGGGGGAKGGFKKEYILSAPLSALLEVDRLSRPQVVKQLWEYIKGNNLQNPQNRREILCDDQLRPIFNTDKIDMFKMNKVLGQHLHETE